MVNKSNEILLSRSYEKRGETRQSSFLQLALANIALASTMFGAIYLIGRADKTNAVSVEMAESMPVESGLAEDSLARRHYNFLVNAAHAMTEDRVIVVARDDLEIESPQPIQEPDEIAEKQPEVTILAEPENKNNHEKVKQWAEKPKTAHESQIWEFFESKGYSPIMTAAIMGNLKQESGLKPHDRPIVYRAGAAFGGLGVAQWGGGRRNNLISMFPEKYEETESQLAFICHELENGNYKDVKKDMQNTTNLAEAVAIFQNRYEKCDPNHCNFTSRNNWAEKYFSQFTNG